MVADSVEYRSALLKDSISLDVYRLFRHLVTEGYVQVLFS